MDLEKLAQQYLQGKDTAALQAAARSEAGARLAARVDGAAVEKAAKEGDTKALSDILQGILATPEGREFAQQVRKAVQQDGR